MVIKSNNKLVGMLCINFDDSRYLAASENVLRLCHPDIFIDDHIAPQQAEPGDPFPRAVPATTESFHNSIDAVAGDAVGRELIRLGVTADRLTPDERMQIIASLENGGIFPAEGRGQGCGRRAALLAGQCVTAIFPRLKGRQQFRFGITRTAQTAKPERNSSDFAVLLLLHFSLIAGGCSHVSKITCAGCSG